VQKDEDVRALWAHLESGVHKVHRASGGVMVCAALWARQVWVSVGREACGVRLANRANRVLQGRLAAPGYPVLVASRDRLGQKDQKASQVRQGFREKQAMRVLVDLQAHLASLARAGHQGCAVRLGSKASMVLEASRVLRVLKAVRGCLAPGAPRVAMVSKDHRGPRACRPRTHAQVIGWSTLSLTRASAQVFVPIWRHRTRPCVSAAQDHRAMASMSQKHSYRLRRGV